MPIVCVLWLLKKTQSYVSKVTCTSSVAERTRSSATAEKQRVSCPHGGGWALQSTPPPTSGYTYAYGRIRNPQQTYVKHAVRKADFKSNRAFKVIQGYPYLCRQEPRAVYCRNVQLIPPLFLKLTKIWQHHHHHYLACTISVRSSACYQ